MADLVLTKIEGDVATVTLNRPEKLNALSQALWARVGEVVADLSADETLRCVVLRGAGERAFSSGADISRFEVERSNLEQARAYGKVMHQTMETIRDCLHPTIAMIKGVCVGGELELAIMCDLRNGGRCDQGGEAARRR